MREGQLDQARHVARQEMLVDAILRLVSSEFISFHSSPRPLELEIGAFACVWREQLA